ncbi:DUF6314 family protein [Streptomyces sp. NPDC059009]|uniref:DUF6314 family protein n=1 Tax=Streptomyces sp. NPDC059009 TaxID=3346694 RepID=UPI0036A1CD1F
MTGRAAPFPVPDVLAYLAGTWRVERTVRDLSTGAEGRFTGTVRFTPDGGGRLRQHESGTFVWQGTPRPAERTLDFEPGVEQGTALVRFTDGRPFHDLDLRSGRHTADHPCAQDLYKGEFEVQDEGHWHMRWRVRGPAKDLVLTTDCTRDNTQSS